MSADFWAAVAAIAQALTVLVAGWALVYARGQVKEARETRERVAQPDVVVYVDHNQNNWHYLDLVIKNFGQTPAYNVRLTLPPLKRVPFANAVTGEEVTEVWLPTSIAVLAPGQEWRSMWDDGEDIAEYEGDLPSQFVGSVQFDGKMNPNKPSFSNPISLDTRMFWNAMYVSTEKAKTVEKALYEISGTLKGYKKKHDGIWVYTVPGDEERQYYEDLSSHLKERHAHVNRQLRSERD
jgi:hypothetical protein